jgi:uncharacterized membrane protein YidH (DUF202 family)
VGYVAGIIAFGIVIGKFCFLIREGFCAKQNTRSVLTQVVAQVFCPTAITLIIAGQLRDRETAGTW